ncbi:hypothetical protein GWN75_31985 [candidate division KSB1 bacterium]|nr:hypothetical protein [candidate division KSB1 bacterium]NIU29029.1 hypothetical protein [candidate division KSB1 bacterium]NIW22921.1 hypothetical protein [candidate division KSB1 bacterium]
MIALSSLEEYEYILKEDRESEDPTVFILRPLSKRDAIEVEDLLGQYAGREGFPTGTFIYKCVKKGWKGARNLRDKKGKKVEFETGDDGCVADDLIFRLNSNRRSELANQVWEDANLTDNEVKNLSSPSRPQKES